MDLTHYNSKMASDKEDKKKVVKEKSKEALSYYLREPYVPFVICIVLSILANEIYPIHDLIPDFISLYGGLAFLAMGLFIFRWGLKHMFLNGEKWSPLHVESRVLIVFGPYHYSRNPMFVVFILFYLTLFVFLNNLWGFIFLIPLVIMLNKYIIQPREKLFEEKYGGVYSDYHNKTGRWL